MCRDADQLAAIYYRHAGQSGAYHLWYVRMARLVLAEHRRRCRECRDHSRTNYNATAPKPLPRFAPGTRAAT